MNEQILRIIASLLSGLLFSMATVKSLGILQQCGYKNKEFLKWLKRKDNMFFNRLCVLSLCLVLTTTCTALCFSFMEAQSALLISALPFMAFLLAFCYADERYALKVSSTPTGRYKRLFAGYFLLLSCVFYALVAFLGFLSDWNGSKLYALIAYAPFAISPMLCPYLLMLANGILGIFENARNKKFIKRAGQVLDESKILRVGVVGSFGKTSVKNILKTLLSEKYTVIETPKSFNTPIGIAKTVFAEEFSDKQILIAEMGARKSGDIAELCSLVKPDYAIFTGVCEQHIQTFGSLEGVLAEKSKIVEGTSKKVVCGQGLKGVLEETEKVVFIDETLVKDVQLLATESKFTLLLGGEMLHVKTSLLGESAVENISLSALLAYEMGVSVEEIARGIAKLSPIPHRLQLMEKNGIYILDDGYNCNPVGAKCALRALGRFEGRKCIVTPGIVEGGILQENINEELGKEIALCGFDKVVLVGETLVKSVQNGYINAGGEKENLTTASDLEGAKSILGEWMRVGDAVLFLNDLPDVY